MATSMSPKGRKPPIPKSPRSPPKARKRGSIKPKLRDVSNAIIAARVLKDGGVRTESSIGSPTTPGTTFAPSPSSSASASAAGITPNTAMSPLRPPRSPTPQELSSSTITDLNNDEKGSLTSRQRVGPYCMLTALIALVFGVLYSPLLTSMIHDFASEHGRVESLAPTPTTTTTTLPGNGNSSGSASVVEQPTSEPMSQPESTITPAEKKKNKKKNKRRAKDLKSETEMPEVVPVPVSTVPSVVPATVDDDKDEVKKEEKELEEGKEMEQVKEDTKPTANPSLTTATVTTATVTSTSTSTSTTDVVEAEPKVAYFADRCGVFEGRLTSGNFFLRCGGAEHSSLPPMVLDSEVVATEEDDDSEKDGSASGARMVWMQQNGAVVVTTGSMPSKPGKVLWRSHRPLPGSFKLLNMRHSLQAGLMSWMTKQSSKLRKQQEEAAEEAGSPSGKTTTAVKLNYEARYVEGQNSTFLVVERVLVTTTTSPADEGEPSEGTTTRHAIRKIPLEALPEELLVWPFAVPGAAGPAEAASIADSQQGGP